VYVGSIPACASSIYAGFQLKMVLQFSRKDTAFPQKPKIALFSRAFFRPKTTQKNGHNRANFRPFDHALPPANWDFF
jgi:hypothetical protein